jgi:hypothetical protein
MGAVGNIVVRAGADTTALTESMKAAQNTILTFKNESMAALKSFGLPTINSTALVESIQSGQRVVVNFTQEAGESLQQFQQRVRTTFQEAGIDVAQYENALNKATSVHAEFAKGAVKNFQAVTDSTEDMSNKSQGIIGQFKDKVNSAFQTMTDSSASFGDKQKAVSGLVSDAFSAMTGAVEIFIAVEVVKTVASWIEELENLASAAEDTQHRFEASTGLMSDEAEKFVEKLSASYGVSQLALKDMMGQEYLNTRMLGFDPAQAETMSEKLVQLSYDLGKLRGEDPAEVFQKLQTGIEGQTRGLSQLGIRITDADIKNRALAEGLIQQTQSFSKSGQAGAVHTQAIDDQTKSLVIYQEVMNKASSLQGYYLQTTDDLSTQTTKLKTSFEEMGVKLATALTPAFQGFMKIVNEVAVDIGYLVDGIVYAIQMIELMVADVYSNIKDISSGNFGAIIPDMQKNYDAIFASKDAVNQYGDALDKGISATNAQDDALNNLNKSANANVMSFDQLHNITNESAAAAQSQANALNDLANTMGNLGGLNLSGLGSAGQGITIPVVWGAVPKFPELPQPPAVVINAVPDVAPAVETAETQLDGLPESVTVPIGARDQTEPVVATAANRLRNFNPNFITVPVGVQDQTEPAVSTIGTRMNTFKTQVALDFAAAGAAIAGWEAQAGNAFQAFKTSLDDAFQEGWSTAGEILDSYANAMGSDISIWVADAGTSIETFTANLHNSLDSTYAATEAITVTWANSIGQTITAMVNNALQELNTLGEAMGAQTKQIANQAWAALTSTYQSVANWVADNKSWLVPAAVVTGAIAVTVATGGLDLAAAGAAAGLVGAAATVPALADGGVASVPTLALISEREPEAVIPLSRLSSVIDSSGGGSSGGSSMPQTIPVILKVDGRELARTMYQYDVNERDRIGTVQGYDSSYNYPK